MENKREVKRSRSTLFDNKKIVAVALRAVKGDEKFEVSRFLKMQLVDRGLLVAVNIKTKDGPGRPNKYFAVTEKGNKYIAKNWK
jgi:predicted transcriptional regulator